MKDMWQKFKLKLVMQEMEESMTSSKQARIPEVRTRKVKVAKYHQHYSPSLHTKR
jgi:hypothetical protein